ncbi:uncharacterized protein [Rutidosis leptorrhynchoides]|uniref:uncharacterized protein n=1 Tax=Rutidosis leptorrhynchoides TaxID=125765 RepID=UPI003A9A115A
MYADLVEVSGNRSVKERLNASTTNDSTRTRQISGKRLRENDKWEHDLYEDDEPRVSGRKVDARDLRLKLQRKSLKHNTGGSLSGVRDLREKLSGISSKQVNVDPAKSKLDASRPAKRNVAVDSSEPETKKVANQAPRKKTKQKGDTSVDNFLLSLGLEKYLLTFQAEEVDMTALIHMSDGDLKAMGMPMGPRKKVLLALESRTRGLEM